MRRSALLGDRSAIKGIPYLTRDPVSIFMYTLRRASEDGMTPGKPALKGLRAWRVERRLRRMLARMSPAEKEHALRLAANYADELDTQARYTQDPQMPRFKELA